MRIHRTGLGPALICVVIAVGATAALPGVSTVYRRFMGRSALDRSAARSVGQGSPRSSGKLASDFQPRQFLSDTSGFGYVRTIVEPWKPTDTLAEIARHWDRAGYQAALNLDGPLADAQGDEQKLIPLLFTKATLMNYEGEAAQAYRILEQLRSIIDKKGRRTKDALGGVLYFQGVTAMRLGENDNCIMCRGESSCILPISPAAIHTKPDRFPAGDHAFHRVPRAVSR